MGLEVKNRLSSVSVFSLTATCGTASRIHLYMAGLAMWKIKDYL